MIDFLATFIVFFAVIDPIGTVPVYVAYTSRFPEEQRRRIALVAVGTASAILVFFVVAGELILNALSIPLSSFQIGGGIILFLFALGMIFGKSKPEEEKQMLEDGNETAIFPLAMPAIAGPGAILAAVLLTENARFSPVEQVWTTVMMLAVLLVQLFLLLGASFVQRLIGDAGASVVSRVMGMLLAAVATTNTIAGIKLAFNL